MAGVDDLEPDVAQLPLEAAGADGQDAPDLRVVAPGGTARSRAPSDTTRSGATGAPIAARRVT